MELVHEPDRDAAVNKFDDLLMQHIGFAVSNTASTLLLGLSFGLMGRVPGTAVTQPTSARSTASPQPSPCWPIYR